MKLFIGILAVLLLFSVYTVSAQLDTVDLIQTFLNQNPDPAEPGKYVELRWKLEKVGNLKVRDIKYVLEVSYPFSFDAIDIPERNLGNWEGYSDKDGFITLFYKVRVDSDAVEDTYKVRLKSNVNSNDYWVSKEYEIRVGDKERPEFILGQISTSPSKLASDLNEAEINVEIANIGDGDAENVIVDVEFPEGFTPAYSYSDREALGTIAAGTSKSATFYVDIDEDVSGVHTAMLYINYRESDDDDNEMKTTVLSLELPLKDKPMFEIEDIRFVPETLYPGTEAEIRLTIKNAGGEEADSVSVRVFKDSSQQIGLTEKSDFIGKMKPGETGEAVLKIEVETDAVAKTYVLDLEIRAVDNDEVIIQDKTITLEVQSPSTSGGMTGNVIAGLSTFQIAGFVVVLIIIAGIAYVSGKKRGRKKKRA
ncbi:MAG: CARDB domain-containing protein [Candidatus Aenigmatarchaeota archaeon]